MGKHWERSEWSEEGVQKASEAAQLDWELIDPQQTERYCLLDPREKREDDEIETKSGEVMQFFCSVRVENIIYH